MGGYDHTYWTGIGWIWGCTVRQSIPATVCRHLASSGGTQFFDSQFPLVWWGSVIIPHSKHSPNPGSAVPGVIG